eukprot:TRINITY_DN25096_c0_g2_i1.p1 TRINITY_DN25096_c0_g2~~TRINITY_DN25096_c0_g2_i1.p1  ORF type:complete len:296 (-),score=37.94 TRINITY_DN25096_c0_g2_i1:130-984(-)
MAFLLVGLLSCLTYSEGVRRADQVDWSSTIVYEPAILNAKQKAWAAERMIDLEHNMCGRHNFPVRTKVKFWWQNCPSGWSDVGFICRTCDGDTEGPFACWEKCGAQRNLPHLPVHCTNLYCVKTRQDCIWKITRITLSWAKVAINLVLNLDALDNVKDVLESAKDMLTAEALLEGVLKPTIDNIINRTKAALIEYMQADNLTMPTMEAIIQGGAEIVALSAAAALKDYFKALDFTGISKAIAAFDGGERCRDLMVTPMPKEGLVNESVSPALGARVFAAVVHEP